MKKKLLPLILASMAIGALTACGGGGSSSTPASSPTSGGSSAAPSSSTTPSSQAPSSQEPSSEPLISSEEPLPDEYDISNYWGGNPSEEYYTVSRGQDNSTVISYEDVNGELAETANWVYVGRSFKIDAKYISRFSEYKKLSFTGKLETTSGSDIVMVKFEGEGGVGLIEKRFNFKSTVSTYELSLNFVSDWNTVTNIYFFVNRNVKETGNGKITLNKMVLSKDEVNPDYDIAPNMPDVPQDWNYYAGEQDKFNIMYRWGYNNEGYIDTTEEDGKYYFHWIGEKTNPYAYVSAKIKGTDDKPLSTAPFKRIAFEVLGTADREAIFKIEAMGVSAFKEQRITFTGEKQIVEVDVTGVLPNPDATGFLALIFPDPGLTGERPSGEITLSACYMDTQEVFVPAVKNEALYPTFFLDKQNKADPCYTIYHDKHITTIDWAKSAPGWESIEYLLDISNTADWWNLKFDRIVGRFKASVDVKILVKPFDSTEIWLDLKANEVYYLDEVFNENIINFDKGTYLFIAAGDEGGSLNGRVQIDDLRITRSFTNVGYDDAVKLNTVTPGSDYATALDESNNLVASYEFQEVGYRAIEMLVTADDIASYNKICGTITATADVHAIIKPMDNNANETKIALVKDTPYELDIPVGTVPFDPAWAKVIIMLAYEAGDALKASVTFGDLRLVCDDPTIVEKGANTAAWSGAYLDKYIAVSECYQLSRVESGDMKIAFSKAAAGWENVQYSMELPEGWWDVKDYNRVHAVFTANVDVTILVKPYDNGAAERRVNLVKDEPTVVDYTFDSAVCSLEKNMILFIAPEGNTGELAGELFVHDFALCREKVNIEDTAKNCIDFKTPGVVDGCYQIANTEEGMKIDYAKTAEQQWTSIQFFSLARTHAIYNQYKITLVASQDCQVTVKVGEANEQHIPLEADVETTVDLPLNVKIDDKWNKSLLFVGSGEGNLTGSVLVKEFYVYQEAE